MQQKTRTEVSACDNRVVVTRGGRANGRGGRKVRASSYSPQRPGRARGRRLWATVPAACLKVAWTVRQRKTEQPGPATTSELLSLKRKACGFQRHEGGATRPRPPGPRRPREHTAGTLPTLPPCPPRVPRRGVGLRSWRGRRTCGRAKCIHSKGRTHRGSQPIFITLGKY